MILVGIMPFFTFGLGTWQLKRLKWKINLIDELEEKLELPPLSLPPNIKFRISFFPKRIILTELQSFPAFLLSLNLSSGAS